MRILYNLFGSLFLIILGYSFIVVTASSFYDWYWKGSLPRSATEASVFAQDKKYAWNSFGRDSVYSFILSESRFAQMFALAVISSQVWALVHFVSAAEKDFTDDRSDYIYSWKCPRDSLECTDESDLDWQGWIIFCILMAAHLLKDMINGLKLLVFCGKRRHDSYSKITYFIGGLFLTWVSVFALYASTVYNIAIARSTTDIIVNAVLIIFVVDMDEHFHKVIMGARSFWRGSGGVEDERDTQIVELEHRLNIQHSELETSLRNRATDLGVLIRNQEEQIKTLLQNFENTRQSNELMEARVKALEGMISPQQPDIS